jgi:hypothetical protein
MKFIEDTTTKDYNDEYIGRVGRAMVPKDILSIERFVRAKVL